MTQWPRSLALVGAGFWQSARVAKVAAERPTVARIMEEQDLAIRIDELSTKRLLPLDYTWQSKLAAMPWPTKNLPEVIEGPTPALQAFIRGYLFVLLFQACAESLASENASRLAAMERAEKNIKDILEKLNRTFHRVRQEAIDEELFDVISGYEALSVVNK